MCPTLSPPHSITDSVAMATAPTGDERLKPDDVAVVLEELLDARNQSYVLGLKLKLSVAEVDSIHSTYSNPRDRLLHVIIAFLKQVQSRPTWRVIVDALRNPVVNLPALAQKVEAAHFPDPASARDAVAETTTDWASTTTDISGDVVKSKTAPQHTSIAEVKGEINSLKKRFNSIKWSTIKCLERCRIAVMTVVYMLTEIRAVDQHKVFLKKKHRVLFRSKSHWELFGLLNFYWNYLAYDLLDQLIEQLTLKESSFESIGATMLTYITDLRKFRQRTRLELFCQAEDSNSDDDSTEDDPPPGFREIVVRHEWPNTVTLEDVENFRKHYARRYNLQKCAMMLNSIRPKCYEVTWFVPVTVIDILDKNIALKVFEDFDVSRIELAGSCVYVKPLLHQVPPLPSTASTSLSAEPALQRKSNKYQVEEGGYQFVNQPANEFFCPVTYDLLLHPHLTSCCGKHLSQEAVARIQGEGGACPLCKMPQLSTVLNKHFQRQVKELHVFCYHENRGCGWQGELSNLECHVQSCPMTDQPLMTDLLKLPLYSREEADLTRREQQQRRQWVSGPGLQSSGRPASLTRNLTAQLRPVLQGATPTSASRQPKPEKQDSVAMTTPSRYEVTYTGVSRGQHKLHVQVNDREISGSPFTITVYPDPTQLGRTVKTVTDLKGPYSIAFNSRGEAVISEMLGCRLSIFDDRGQKIRTFGSCGDSLHQMISPAGIAIDEMDNIYVSSEHKLQKFTSSTKLIKWVGQEGRKEGEFEEPRGVTLHNNQVYVCDCNNHRIQVFDLDLNFVGSIGSRGRGEFDKPHDVKFDTAGNMYVAEYGRKRVQVMDISGHFIRSFGEGKLGGPSGLHIADNFVYVSDISRNCIVVYETSGQFVTKFGRYGHKEREFYYPSCITSCTDGFIHVCDYWNNRVQIF